MSSEPVAVLGGRLATDLRETTDDPAVLDGDGFWVVAFPFEGRPLFARFGTVRPLGGSRPAARDRAWSGPAAGAWTSSLDRDGYVAGVEEIRRRIGSGDVYQVNLCRVIRAPLPAGHDRELLPLATVLARGNPAPHAFALSLPGTQIVSASPELFLRRDGDVIESAPIKGTGREAADLLPKDVAENVMIVDLVRNDLGQVCREGTVEVRDFLDLERHPGLVHLVSTVRGRLRAEVTWREVFDATFPPGSVTGAPKSSAMRTIGDLEPVPRGPYCGALGWVDADRGTAELAVGIRTFWLDGDDLCFGTGAGITWGSEGDGEWRETELKAELLVRLASVPDPAAGPHVPTASSSPHADAGD